MSDRRARGGSDGSDDPEGLFRILAEQSPGMIFVNQGGRNVYVNQRCSEVTGYSREELCDEGFDFRSLVAPEHRPLLDAAQVLHRAGEEVPQYEYDLITREGRRIHAVNATRLIQSDGEPAILGIVTDVSDLKEARNAHAESEALHRTLLETLPDAVTLTDLEGRILVANHQAARLHGVAGPDDVVAQLSAFELIAPEDRERAVANARRTLTEGGVRNVTYTMLRKDGSRFPAELNASLLRDLEGRPMGFIGVVRDITDRVQAEEERFQLEQQVQHSQRLESLGVLAGGIAHDFNNLLVGMLGNANLARMELADGNDRLEGYLEQIEVAAARAADLTQQMLAFAGRGRFVVQLVDLNAQLEAIARLLRVGVPRSVEIARELEAELPLVRGDPSQLQQVIMNLITNAADAIGDRSGRITIRTGRLKEGQREPPGDVGVGVLPDRACVLLEVEDTGVGMDPQTRARIFDPFFTTKMEGRGLGLAAVLGIVRRHEGVIRLTSTPDVGTRVRVVLPIAAGARVEAQAARDAPFHGRGRALVVDDEPLVRDVAASMLAHMGFDVVTAAGGAEALELFERQPAAFEIVLLDLTMPGLGGLETLQALRRIRADVRIVLCSGIAQTAPEEVDEEQIAGFLRKPFRADQLAEVLVAAFARPG